MAKKNLFNPDDFKITALQEDSAELPAPVAEESVPVTVPVVEAPKPAKEKDAGKKAMPLYLSPEQYAYLSYMARRSKKPMNTVVRELIDASMQENPNIAQLSKDFI